MPLSDRTQPNYCSMDLDLRLTGRTIAYEAGEGVMEFRANFLSITPPALRLQRDEQPTWPAL